jgi:hypothetical protein
MNKVLFLGLVFAFTLCDAFITPSPTHIFSRSAVNKLVSHPLHARKITAVNGLRHLKGVELPPVLGLGFKSLFKRLVVITGTTSGLGLATLRALLKRGDSFVVCAVRDVQKMKDIIAAEKLDSGAVAVLKLDLGSLQSVRDFVFNLKVVCPRSFDSTLMLLCKFSFD